MTDDKGVITDVEADIQAIVAFLKTFEGTLVADVKAIVAGLTMGGDYAAALVAYAKLLAEAASAWQTLQTDVQADIPANVKAFLASTGVLEADFTIPFINQSVCNVTFLGTHDEFVSAVAGGMAI